MNFKNKSLLIDIFISVFIGILVFVILYGVEILKPTYIDWIDNVTFRTKDLSMHYLGWKFFKDAPWMFPLGLFNTLSYPTYSSIFLTDSIPLFAIFFKLFAHIFPNDFQYFGFYALFSYVMFSMLSMFIIRKYIKENKYRVLIIAISCVLLSLSSLLPFVLFARFQVASFWLFLLSFIPIVYYNELSFKKKTFIFFLVALISGLINVYILALCGIIMLGYILYDFLKTKKTNSFIILPIFIVSSLFALYITGLLNVEFVPQNHSLLNSSFNLNGFLNPFESSQLLKDLNVVHFFQVEGYCYLGLGLILLIIFELIILIKRFIKKEIIIKDKELLIVLIILSIFSLIIALSPRVTFNDYVLFEYSIPQIFYDLWSVVRITARFIWILYFIIVFSSVLYVITKYKAKATIFILSLVTIIQIIDFQPQYAIIRSQLDSTYYHKAFSYMDGLDSFKDFAKNNKNKKIYLTPIIYMFDTPYFYYRIFDMVVWLERNNYKVTNFYFGRELKKPRNEYEYALKNPKDSDVFLYDKEFIDFKNIDKSNLNYFYDVEEFLIMASKNKLKGMDKYEISKDMLYRMKKR